MNSTAFPTIRAFNGTNDPRDTGQVNECIALGGGTPSEIVDDRDWRTFNSAVLQFSEAFDKLRWMNRFC